MEESKVIPNIKIFLVKGYDREKCRRSDVACDGLTFGVRATLLKQMGPLGIKSWLRFEVEQDGTGGEEMSASRQ
jgi:hypothetical protein